MRLAVSIILACAVWLAAAQAMADVEAVLDVGSNFTCVESSIQLSCSRSTPYNDIAWIRWDWDNDGNFDTGYLVWPDYATVWHQWGTGETYQVTVEVSNNDHSDLDTATSGNIYVCEPIIGATTCTPWADEIIYFDAGDSLPVGEDTSWWWDFEDDSHWDAYTVTTSHKYAEPGWYTCRLRVYYLGTQNYCETTIQIHVFEH